jgi:hypothetical protein
MEVELEEKKMRMVRDVKTKLEPDKMEMNKSKKSGKQAIGG